MSSLGEVIEVTGEIDFDSRNPILEEENGKRWRLVGADHLFISDEVTVAGVRRGESTLEVRAVLHERWGEEERRLRAERAAKPPS